ncbi:MAG: hypothetical protein IKY82_08465 [Alistipes sp.]|nr:hypothetical protein [Alistipes sp.]
MVSGCGVVVPDSLRGVTGWLTLGSVCFVMWHWSDDVVLDNHSQEV